MNGNILLSGWIIALVSWLASADLHAGFIIDGFATPASDVSANNASLGQTVDLADALGGKREFNITALFDSNVRLVINNGTATYTVTPTAANPSASLTLRYVDNSAANTLTANDHLIRISNVSATSNWNLAITMRGNGSALPSTASATIPGGANGPLDIHFSTFTGASPYALGGINDVQFLFTTNSGGLLSLGPINVTAVPEPSWLAPLALLAGFMSRNWRRPREVLS